jgi:hypothetical protein
MADGAAYLFRRNEVNPDQWDYVTRLISPGADQCVGGRKLSDFSIQSNPEENTEAKRCALEVSRTANDDFGCAVLLQGDLAVIGARFAEGEDGSYGVGAVHVFRRDENGTDQWINVATLTPKETTGGAYFGTALALAGDTLIVGAPGTNIGQGKAYVFERNAGGSDQWGETGQLAPSDGVSNADFGKSIALDDEASIVGAMGDGNWRGAVYVFAPPISPEPPSPAFPPTGELVNGGIVEGLNGVLLGALEGTLSQPLAIWIQEVEAPAQALWPLATPVGSFYNIGAVTTTVAPQEQEFGLAMPVPDGADTAHLGIALLGPRSRLLDDLGAEDEWLPIPGYYESESRLFSIALSYLFIEGSIVVLVEHPNLVPLSLPSAQTPSASPQLRSLTIQDADFSVKCGNFTDAGQCLPEDERTFEKRLQDTYDKYTGLGYSGPALHHGIMTVNLLGIKNFIRIETAEYTGNQINDGSVEPCVSGPKAQYMTVARIMTFCYQRDHDDDVTVGSETRHEMFHAFQHHFEALSRDVLNATQGVDLDNVLPSQKSRDRELRMDCRGHRRRRRGFGGDDDPESHPRAPFAPD